MVHILCQACVSFSYPSPSPPHHKHHHFSQLTLHRHHCHLPPIKRLICASMPTSSFFCVSINFYLISQHLILLPNILPPPLSYPLFCIANNSTVSNTHLYVQLPPPLPCHHNNRLSWGSRETTPPPLPHRPHPRNPPLLSPSLLPLTKINKKIKNKTFLSHKTNSVDLNLM